MVGAVLSWLPAEAVLRCGLVSRAWHHVALDDVLWRHLIDRDLGPSVQVHTHTHTRMVAHMRTPHDCVLWLLARQARGADEELSMMATYFLRLRDTSVAVPLWGASGCGKTTLFDLVEDTVAMSEQQGERGAHSQEVRKAKRAPTAPYQSRCSRDYKLGKREVRLRGMSLRAVLVDLPGTCSTCL
jgi:hypothetical protein